MVALVLHFSAKRINDPVFWKTACQWMNANLETADQLSLERCISFCASVGVPLTEIKGLVEKATTNLEKAPLVKSSAKNWLNLVHGLGILGSLSYSEACKALRGEFFHDLKEHANKHALLGYAIRILQIASCIRYDLKRDPKVSREVLDYVNETIASVEALRYKNRHADEISSFRQILYFSAKLNSFCTPPQLHIPTGSFVEAMLWIDSKRGKILPLNMSAQEQANAQQVAILFGVDSLFTKVDIGENGLLKYRPIGEISMNMRHLRAANIRPVFITQLELNALCNQADQIPFVKEKIFKIETEEQSWL